MKKITVVTGNPDKLLELQRLFPSEYTLESVDLDLAEIQSMDPLEIAVDKAKRAYAKVGGPVFVDDVSAGLEELNGLPGPFIKFFEKQLGKGALYLLAKQDQPRCTITSIAAYYDGTRSINGIGEIQGTIVEPRGEIGFGFDFVFVPDGHTQTFAEMGPEEKDKISHRTLAVQNLIQQLNEL